MNCTLALKLPGAAIDRRVLHEFCCLRLATIAPRLRDWDSAKHVDEQGQIYWARLGLLVHCLPMAGFPRSSAEAVAFGLIWMQKGS